jgi:predicted permease
MLAIRNLVRALFRRDAMNRDMNAEMRDHLAQATERLMARGLSREDAELEARREFGNVGVLAEQGRDARGASWVETARGDARYAIRALRHNPTFALVAILSLGIGIGANTAIFGLINALILRPLPVEQPERLAVVGVAGDILDFSNPLFESFRDRAAAIGTVAATGPASFNLASSGVERLVAGAYVSGDYFRAAGVRAAMGRTLTRDDDVRGCAPVAVVSHAFWRSELGSRPDVVGSRLTLTEKPYTIVGVAAPGYSGIVVGDPESVWIPLCLDRSLTARTYWWLTAIVRSNGQSEEQLNSQLAAVSRATFGGAIPEHYDAKGAEEFLGQRITAIPAANGMSAMRGQYASALWALMGMVAIVLLISCANVANLLLARGAARAREVAIRVAIGASRARIMRQMLTECALLALGGAVLGVALGQWINRALLSLIGPGGGAALDVPLDTRMVAFTAALAALTVILCGIVPAWRATLVDPQSVMKAGTARGGSSRFRIGRVLVVAQCALALTVVTAAGLLVGTLRRLTSTELGFDPKGVVLATVNLKREQQGLGNNLDVQRAVLDAIRAIPGVRDAAIANLTPVGRGAWNGPIATDGMAPAPPRERLSWFNSVSDGYFRTLRTRIVAGREFDASDTKGSARVAVVNEAMARKYLGGGNPVGKTFRIDYGETKPTLQVVGLVENAKYRNLRAVEEPIVYMPAAQDTDGWARPTYVVRSDAPSKATSDAIAAAAARVDPRMSLRIRTLDEQVEASVQRERVLAVLSGSFGAIAFVLAMIGLYGVMAYTIARRRLEIGVRIALGAARGRVVSMVLGEVGRLMAIGVVIGGIAAYAATPLMKQFLYGLEPNDPGTIIVAIAILSGGAILAGAIPARRAASLQPVEALRED